MRYWRGSGTEQVQQLIKGGGQLCHVEGQGLSCVGDLRPSPARPDESGMTEKTS